MAHMVPMVVPNTLSAQQMEFSENRRPLMPPRCFMGIASKSVGVQFIEYFGSYLTRTPSNSRLMPCMRGFASCAKATSMRIRALHLGR